MPLLLYTHMQDYRETNTRKTNMNSHTEEDFRKYLDAGIEVAIEAGKVCFNKSYRQRFKNKE